MILLLGEDADGVAYDLGFGLPPLSRQRPINDSVFASNRTLKAMRTPLSCNTQGYCSSDALSTYVLHKMS